MSSTDVPETFKQIFKTCMLLQNVLTGDSRFVLIIVKTFYKNETKEKFMKTDGLILL